MKREWSASDLAYLDFYESRFCARRRKVIARTTYMDTVPRIDILINPANIGPVAVETHPIAYSVNVFGTRRTAALSYDLVYQRRKHKKHLLLKFLQKLFWEIENV